MLHPWVSILVPIYNVEDYIERCARSIFEQTYENIEYVFLDDAATDRSIDVLEKVMKDYPERAEHVRIIHHTDNKGLAITRNDLVDACQTDWLMHLDSDDWVEKDILELFVEKQQQTGADIVLSNVVCHYQAGDVTFNYPIYEQKECYVELVLRDKRAHGIGWKLICTALYRKYRIQVHPDGSIGEDWQAIVPLFYYAKKIGTIHLSKGHYNGMAIGSLTKKDEDTVAPFCKSILVSLNAIKQFLSDKEKRYQDIFRTIMFQSLLNYMCLLAYWEQKDEFLCLQSHVRTLVSEDHTLIEGFKPCLSYQLKSHYWMYRFFLHYSRYM